MDTAKLTRTVISLVRKTIETRFSGANYADLAQARGYADGYMRALLDAGIITQPELLKLVGEERRRFVEEASEVTARNVA